MKYESNAIREIFFEIGGYFGGFHKVVIRKGDQGYAVCVYHTEWGQGADLCVIRPFTEKKWSNLLQFLTEKIQVWNWEEEYVNPNILDGTDWSLGFTFSDGSERWSGGSNAFPPLFDKLEKRFEKLYKDVMENRVPLDEQREYLPLFRDMEGVDELIELADRKECPVCGRKMIRILYGLPTPIMTEAEENNPDCFMLGGCCGGNRRDPMFLCPDCSKYYYHDLTEERV